MSLICHVVSTQVWDDEACKPIVSLLAEISAIRSDPSLAPWLADWRPLELYQHGALEPANVVVDVQNIFRRASSTTQVVHDARVVEYGNDGETRATQACGIHTKTLDVAMPCT